MTRCARSGQTAADLPEDAKHRKTQLHQTEAGVLVGSQGNKEGKRQITEMPISEEGPPTNVSKLDCDSLFAVKTDILSYGSEKSNREGLDYTAPASQGINTRCSNKVENSPEVGAPSATGEKKKTLSRFPRNNRRVA